MQDIFMFLKKFEKLTRNVDLMVAGALLFVLAIMLIPLPPFMLDMSLTASLALSLWIL